MTRGVVWPERRAFAFTVFDDTDNATLDSVTGVYSLLSRLGLRTTKSVWPITAKTAPLIGGSTCDDEDYLRWLLSLQEQGFEIGLHNVGYATCEREDISRGLDRFRGLFGHDPVSFANHVGCGDGIYWGCDRLSGFHKRLYKLYSNVQRNRPGDCFEGRGHLEGDPAFWGDLCKARIKYVRNFVFRDINTLAQCPFMPYTDPARPFVNYWYASSDGANVSVFNGCVSEENQDRLEEQGGACIMYTHFAAGFQQGEEVNPRFRELMTRLSRKNGWFVPVGQLLDYLLQVKGAHTLTSAERAGLERRWIADRSRAVISSNTARFAVRMAARLRATSTGSKA